jgi:hypothetical protein
MLLALSELFYTFAVQEFTTQRTMILVIQPIRTNILLFEGGDGFMGHILARSRR